MTLGDGMAHLADLLDRVAGAVQSIVLKATPLDGSPAMAELAAEEPYRTPRMQTPLANTTTYASVLGYAVTDATKAYAHHLRHPDLLVWAPFVNARAGLDAAAYAFWLVEPQIGVEFRVQRGMAFRLHNAREQLRAPAELTTAKDLGRNALASIKESSVVNTAVTAARIEPGFASSCHHTRLSSSRCSMTNRSDFMKQMRSSPRFAATRPSENASPKPDMAGPRARHTFEPCNTSIVQPSMETEREDGAASRNSNAAPLPGEPSASRRLNPA